MMIDDYYDDYDDYDDDYCHHYHVDENGILQKLESIGLSALESKNIVRQIINSCIRSTYYIFCKRKKGLD